MEPSTTLKGAITEFIRSFALWRIWLRLGIQDIRLRFKRSVIGIWWIFLNLAVMIIAIGFIYGNLLGQDLRQFIPYLTIGIVAWGYITNSIVLGGNAFIESEGYIKQISLPIYVYVFRFFVSIGLNSLISLVAFVVIALIYQVRLELGTLWAIPGFLIQMGVSLLLITIFAYLNARFRDVAHLATVAMQVMFYVTPVLYPAELLRQRGIGLLIDLNPFYNLLEVVRHPLLFGSAADGSNYLISGAVMIILSCVAMITVVRYGRRVVYFL